MSEMFVRLKELHFQSIVCLPICCPWVNHGTKTKSLPYSPNCFSLTLIGSLCSRQVLQVKREGITLQLAEGVLGFTTHHLAAGRIIATFNNLIV